MIEVNAVGAYIGMGIACVGIAILWFLADKPEKKAAKKNKHLHPHQHK